ncbi:hypothetical protein K7432_009335 [Basidiobolus ranarum]|uniref:Uncharacterized protein n=1 Tax=Basidiobolus ranarum TaxID=34480 RepID=A0ABR2WQD3_9FUNG
MPTLDHKQEAKRHVSVRSASEWNKLLLWARKARGPFYDPSTRLHQVNKGSRLYFSGVRMEDLDRDPGSPPSGNRNLKTTEHQLASEINNKYLAKNQTVGPVRVSNRGRPKKLHPDTGSMTNTPGSVSSVLN